jgi:hypothetical protein
LVIAYAPGMGKHSPGKKEPAELRVRKSHFDRTAPTASACHGKGVDKIVAWNDVGDQRFELCTVGAGQQGGSECKGVGTCATV